MMDKQVREPILKIEMFVDEHDTKEPSNADKPDVYSVTLKADEKTFKVGLDDAKAKLTIKAFDDIIKHNLPLLHSFTVEIYPAVKSVKVEQPKTSPTTLNEIKS